MRRTSPRRRSFCVDEGDRFDMIANDSRTLSVWSDVRLTELRQRVHQERLGRLPRSASKALSSADRAISRPTSTSEKSSAVAIPRAP